MADKEKTEKKKLLNIKGWWWKLPVAGIGVVGLINALSGSPGAGKLPECSSSNASTTLTNAFDQSQFARQASLSVVRVSDQNELTGSTEQQRNCSAKILLNNGNETGVVFKMNLQEGGTFLLSFEVRP